MEKKTEDSLMLLALIAAFLSAFVGFTIYDKPARGVSAHQKEIRR